MKIGTNTSHKSAHPVFPSPSIGMWRRALALTLPALLATSSWAQTVGGGTLANPAVGPAPAYNYEYGSLISGAVLVKNWDFGSAAGNTVHNMSEMSTNFQYHDQFNQIINNGSYGAKIVSPDSANALGGQPIEGVNTATPVREFLTSSLKTYLVPLNGATTMDANLHNTGNGSFVSKWTAPNGGSLLGMDLIWETKVRYVTPPFFWFALWTSGQEWGSPKGAEMDVIESFGYNNGSGFTNYDGRYWHVDVIGNDLTLPVVRAQDETPYVSSSWNNCMGRYGITAFNATQWHTWTWVYKANNTFTVYMDGIPVQRGMTWWTKGAYAPDSTHFPLNMRFLFDAGWGNTAVGGMAGFTVPASDLVGKYYEFDYSRVYYRPTTTNDIKNLALTATITSYSTQEASNPVSKAINDIYNNDADRWSTSSAGYPAFIELDLGSNKQVVSTELIDVIGKSYKYKIEAKPDGGAYATVVDKTAGTSISPIQADNFATVTARYVKLTITGSANGTTWIGLREFKVMGSNAVVPGLPSPWVNQDVGTVGVAGSASYASGSFTVKGSGADIDGTADAFQYVYQPATGDCSIIAKVESITQSDYNAKSGVMMRQSVTDAGSPHAFMYIPNLNKACFKTRSVTGGATTTVPNGTAIIHPPNWVKLTRVGNVFTGYFSPDGVTWTLVGSQTIVMPSTIYLGLPATSRVNTALTTVVISNVTAVP